MEKLDSKKYIEDIIGREISWFDYQKLDQAKQADYYNDAQLIVKSEVFNNEISRYTADMIKWIAMESPDHNKTQHIRSLIVGLETLKQRLESIENPRRVKEPVEDIHSAI